jgi:hypothetical protein
MNVKTKLIALGGSIAAIATMTIGASGVTGAYFSASKSGTVTGTLGTVSIATSGGNSGYGSDGGIDFQWTNMLPGVANSATVNYANTGSAPVDVYLTFPNDVALSAINDLGTYGEVHISTPTRGEIFASTNLRDTNNGNNGTTAGDSHGCLPYNNSPASPPSQPFPGCNPLPNVVLIATGVAPGNGGSFTFSFNYASKLSGGQGGTFNVYPATDSSVVTHSDNSSTGSGLPFRVVAEQGGAPALVATN